MTAFDAVDGSRHRHLGAKLRLLFRNRQQGAGHTWHLAHINPATVHVCFSGVRPTSLDRYRVAGNEPLSPGRHTIVLDYKQSPIEGPEVTGGPAALSVDGTEVASGDIAKVVPKRFSATETLDIGMDLGATVTKIYEDRAPFAFTGTIDDVNVELE